MHSINNQIDCIGLEKEFESYVTQNVNIHDDCGFKDYLEPNEAFPQGIKPHLLQSEMGIMISAGTERCFFNLTFCDQSKCQGLAARDINPKVKAYIDFNTMLIRLSATRQEYATLSEQTKDEQSFNERIALLTQKLETSSLPDKMRTYYLKHLRDFGSIYLNAPQNWRRNQTYRIFWTDSDSDNFKDQFTKIYDNFEECAYHQSDESFLKIKKFADSGNIISTIGSVNDLGFLKTKTISVVDVSNIPDYCMIHLQAEGDFHPRVIRTALGYSKTLYRSYIHQVMTFEEEQELDTLLYKIGECKQPGKGTAIYNYLSQIGDLPGPEKCSSEWMQNMIHNDDDDLFQSDAGPIYSKETLNRLRKYVAEHVLEIPNFGPVIMDPYCIGGISKFNDATPEQIEELCRTNEEIKRFATVLADAWLKLDRKIYLAFSQLEGWEDKDRRFT